MLYLYRPFLSVSPLISDIESKSGILSGCKFILLIKSSIPSGPDISDLAGDVVLLAGCCGPPIGSTTHGTTTTHYSTH